MCIFDLQAFDKGKEAMTVVYDKIVPFYDVDAMKVVWHGNYVKYLEEARCAYLAAHNMTYNDMERIGYAFPVVELKIKYIRPCVFGQKIVIMTDLEACDNFLFFKYEILDAVSGQKMAKAETKQMCVQIDTRETLFEIPEVVLKQIGLK